MINPCEIPSRVESLESDEWTHVHAGVSPEIIAFHECCC